MARVLSQSQFRSLVADIHIPTPLFSLRFGKQLKYIANRSGNHLNRWQEKKIAHNRNASTRESPTPVTLMHTLAHTYCVGVFRTSSVFARVPARHTHTSACPCPFICSVLRIDFTLSLSLSIPLSTSLWMNTQFEWKINEALSIEHSLF